MRLTEQDAKALGAALRAQRERVKMSRAVLARLIERDPATIQGYEQGGKRAYGKWIVASPHPTTLEAIARHLGTGSEELLTAAGLSRASEEEAAPARNISANDVRAANAALSGVVVSGTVDDIRTLLGVALESGLMGKLDFSPVRTTT